MITHLARIDVMIKDKFKPNVFSDERLLHGEGPIWDEKRKLIWVADVHGYRILGFDIDGNIIEDHKLNHKPASFFFSDKCILQSPADSDAFQSGRCAKHNGRPETMYF